MKAVTILKMLVLGALVSLVSCNREIRIDDNLPAGNIIVEKVSGDTVYVKPDLRDTEGEWFYWAMRVQGAQGKTLVFKFPFACVGVRGAVVSLVGRLEQLCQLDRQGRHLVRSIMSESGGQGCPPGDHRKKGREGGA